MTKAEIKQNIKRMNILDSAYRLFTDAGFASTAIDDIVKSAGIAKGTFYLYFKDKYDLLDQLIVHKGSDIIVESYKRAFSDESKNFEDKVITFINNIIDFLVFHRELAALVQKNLSSFFRSVLNTNNSELRQSLKELTNGFIEKGYSRENAEKTIYLLTDFTGSVCCDAVVYGKPYSIEDIRPLFTLTVRNIIRQGANFDD